MREKKKQKIKNEKSSGRVSQGFHGTLKDPPTIIDPWLTRILEDWNVAKRKKKIISLFFFVFYFHSHLHETESME